METGWARFGGVQAHGVCDYADLRTAPHALADGGWWAVVAEFDGPWHAWRFTDVRAIGAGAGAGAEHVSPTGPAAHWYGPAPDTWTSSMDQQTYEAAVQAVRDAVREGNVYQANICRVLSAPMPARPDVPDAGALAAVLAAGNPAPYAGAVQVPGVMTSTGRSTAAPTSRAPTAATAAATAAGAAATTDPEPARPGAWVVTASPELGISVADGIVTSGPIKGTARTAEGLKEKDRAENVMITDLVRNDLQRVCAPGTVAVTDLLAVEAHPGLVHLVSRVTGSLVRPDLSADGARGWAELLAATQPPGSVSGAPKSSALQVIERLEHGPRGPYCGQIGWIDADTNRAELAVGIRTFWWDGQALRFGTGAGITYGSDPAGEWAETELKAARLVALASGNSGKVDP